MTEIKVLFMKVLESYFTSFLVNLLLLFLMCWLPLMMYGLLRCYGKSHKPSKSYKDFFVRKDDEYTQVIELYICNNDVLGIPKPKHRANTCGFRILQYFNCVSLIAIISIHKRR